MVSNKGQDSSYIRVEHNLAKADPIKININNFRLNTQHYWKIDGLLTTGFVSKLRLSYDGNKNPSGFSYLDTCLTTLNGDSMILLYRRNAADDWKEVKHYTKFKSSSKAGFFTADTLKLGEYCFANGKSAVLIGIDDKAKPAIELVVYPNPAQQFITVSVPEFKITPQQYFEIIDIEGKTVINNIYRLTDETKIDISQLAKGKYLINFVSKNKILKTESFIVD